MVLRKRRSGCLGYVDTKKALIQHCKKDGVAIYPLIDSMGRQQEAKFINEGNLYRLITHSKLESAERFESWVFDEVIPTIRQTGSYTMPLPPTPEKAPLTINPGEIARLINTTSRLMERQGASSSKVAENAELICNQYGIKLCRGFVKKSLSERLDEIYARREQEGKM